MKPLSHQIHRRDFTKALLALAAFSASPKATPADQKQKPNIIYILLDDAGYGDLGCYGQQMFQTPHIDQMARQGIRFTNHYAGSTVCAPSRCALMTGLHTGHAQIRGNKSMRPEGQAPLEKNTVTIATLLQEQGYKTGAFGKWGLGPPGSTGDPLNQGFQQFFGYLCQHKAHNYYPAYLWHNRQKIRLDGKTYSHDLIMEKAMQFIQNNKNHPFFLYLPVTIPHASMHVPEESARPYRKKFKKYELMFGFYAGRPVRNPPACFAGMMTRLDQQIGRMMALLDNLGIEKNTLIMLSSDNGPHKEGGHLPHLFNSNGPFRGLKRDLYEGGIRVPFIAKWPEKIKPGSITHHACASWDIMPTICQVTAIKTPKNIDGISFLPTMIGDQNRQQKHDYLYWEFHELGGKQAVRMDKWKAVKNYVSINPYAEMELYNLQTDPGESKNLADHHPQIVRKMEAIFQEARTPSDTFKLFKVPR